MWEVILKQFLVVVEFLCTPDGLIFYLAHIFLVAPGFPQQTSTLETIVTAATPEEALKQGEYLTWLLSL